MRLRFAALCGATLALLVVLAACGSGASSVTHAASATGGQSATTAQSTAAAHSSTGFHTVTVAVPKGNAATPLNKPHTLRVPTGWKVEAWARVPGARFETWTPEHDLLVSESGPGKVVELIPGKNPAAPPAQRVLLKGLQEPQGMAFDTLDGKRVLYVAQDYQLDRYVWNANGTLGARTVIVTGLLNPHDPGNHFAKTLLIAKNHMIYMTGGSYYNVSAKDLHAHPERAVIYTVNPSTHKLGIFATGIRNGEGLAFAPNGSLWTAVNERDNLAYPFHKPYGKYSDAYGKVIQAYVNNHPPDELARLTKGRNLGWPFCDPDPDVHPGQANSPLHYTNLPFDDDAQTNPGGRYLNCSKLAPLNRGLPAHSAPLGLTFLEHSSVAGKWRNGALVAVHGSWDRNPQGAPTLLWLPWDSGADNFGNPVDLVSGFQLGSITKGTAGVRWGRPVDAVPGPDGQIYLSDDQSGTVFRIGP